MTRSAITALVADCIAGEPPTPLHPTVWMGRWLGGGRARRRTTRPASSFAEGALLLGGGVAIAAVVAHVLSKLLDIAPIETRNVLCGIALKPALSLRALTDAAATVQDSLERNRLHDARRALSWHLVSRDTSTLSRAEVAGAAIESVAENLSDSVVAPLLAFRAGGLAAAYAYRMINTADAMFGYRTHELEWFGKAAARVDDAANFLPSRATAMLICVAAAAGDGSAPRALHVAAHDARRTASPNAGWPMAAMAGALGVRLTKRGQYILNDDGRAPTAADIGRACRIAFAVSALAALAADLA